MFSYIDLYPEYTAESVQKALDAIVQKHGNLDPITVDYYVRSAECGGLGMGNIISSTPIGAKAMIKPDFRVYKHNTTNDWHSDIVAIGGTMYDVYIFDSNIHVHACELASSYEMRYIGPTWSGTPAHADDSEEQRQDFFEDVNDNCNETREVLYIHSLGLDLKSCKRIDIDDKRWKSLIEDSDGDEEQAWKTAYSEVFEYCQCNGYTY